jgi:hypothetical protein
MLLRTVLSLQADGGKSNIACGFVSSPLPAVPEPPAREVPQVGSFKSSLNHGVGWSGTIVATYHTRKTFRVMA